MVVKSFVQIQLPSDPAGVLQSGTKQYIDAADATKVGSVTAADASVVCSGTTTVTVKAARVTSPANTVAYSATLALDPTLGNNQNITATGALSLSISTTGAIDGQMVMVSVLASGAQRVVTLTSTTMTTGQSSTLTITSGKVGMLGFRYSSLNSAWNLMSATQTV